MICLSKFENMVLHVGKAENMVSHVGTQTEDKPYEFMRLK